MSVQENTDLLFQECYKLNPDIETIQKLIKLGIDPSQWGSNNSYKAYTLLMAHLVHSNCPDPKIITMLVNAGVKIQAKDWNQTALLYAGNNKNSSLEVFQTLFKLGAHINDSFTEHDVGEYSQDRFKYGMALEYKGKFGYSKDHQHICKYLLDTRNNRNVENTQINGLYLHRALEEYILNTHNPQASEISKIIKTYKQIPGIYPTNYDFSNKPSRFLETKVVSEALFQTLKVFYLAAAARCSIGVFQTLIFDYGIEMAERFGMNLFDILAGNYCFVDDIDLEEDYRNRFYPEPDMSQKAEEFQFYIYNILSHYIEAHDTTDRWFNSHIEVYDFGTDPEIFSKGSYAFPQEPFDLDTFKYLVSILHLNFGPVSEKTDDDNSSNNDNDEMDDDSNYGYSNEYDKFVNDDDDRVYYPLHPLLQIISRIGDLAKCDTLKNPDTFLDIVKVLLDSDSNVNLIDNHGNNLLMRYFVEKDNYYKACKEVDVRVVTAIIEAGIDLNYKNKLKRRSINVMKSLMKLGIDVDEVNNKKNTI